MRRMTRLLTAGVLSLALLVCTVTAAGAEPGKNQITVTGAQCSDGESTFEITFILNAMGKGLKLPEGDGNLVTKGYTLKYEDPITQEPIVDPATGEPVEIVYGSGKKVGQTGDLVTCGGETTTEIVGFGLVTIDYELTGFFTPRG